MPIKPTVGRKVWYHPFQHERIEHYRGSTDQPLDATVLHVHSDTCVNLLVFNEEGGRVPSKTSVTLRDSYAETNQGECGWMPYQVGQAGLVQNVVAPLAQALAVTARAAAEGIEAQQAGGDEERPKETDHGTDDTVAGGSGNDTVSTEQTGQPAAS